ncbi:unnamed protein product [Phytophthora fragariaefolia]|uniref:Unnamed protein product n=1 Tax=Phytophthora fragariaefolia TaxID=1490495 RepID=A0A9W6YNB8_9STRA|nr:unnamed protein product [Phytophthora fragariaefolia]
MVQVAVDVKNELGISALHWAARASEASPELVTFFVHCGLDPFDTDSGGRTALHYASTSQNFDIVDFFLKDCFNAERPPESDLLRTFLEAAKGDQLGLVKYLIEYGVDARYTNFQGKNALHDASAADAIDVLDFLISHVLDLHQADKFGATPVLEAARHGQLECLCHLLNASGDVT